MPDDYSPWLSAFGSGAYTEAQVVNLTGFNGTDDTLIGDIVFGADENDPNDSHAGGVTVDTNVTNFTGFNGVNNAHDGELVGLGGGYGYDPDEPVGEYEVNVEVDTSDGVNVSVDFTGITAGYGVDNVLGGSRDAAPESPVEDIAF